MNTPVNLADKLAQFSEHWSPRAIAQLNDYDILVVKVQDEFTARGQKAPVFQAGDEWLPALTS